MASVWHTPCLFVCLFVCLFYWAFCKTFVSVSKMLLELHHPSIHQSYPQFPKLVGISLGLIAGTSFKISSAEPHSELWWWRCSNNIGVTLFCCILLCRQKGLQQWRRRSRGRRSRSSISRRISICCGSMQRNLCPCCQNPSLWRRRRRRRKKWKHGCMSSGWYTLVVVFVTRLFCISFSSVLFPEDFWFGQYVVFFFLCCSCFSL